MTRKADAPQALRQPEPDTTIDTVDVGRMQWRLFESAPALIAVHEGPGHRYVYSNPAHDRAVGHRPLIGRTLREAMPELAGQGVYERFDEAFRSGQAREGAAVRVTLAGAGDGADALRWFDQVIQPWTGPDGAVAGVMTFASDVTTQVEARQIAERRREELEFALDAGRFIGTWDWNVTEDRIRVDARFARLFGVPDDRLDSGVPLARFVAGIHEADRDRIAAAIERAVATGAEYQEEYRVRDAEGAIRWVTARGRCLHSLDGTPIRFPGAVADISEQVAARERVAASEAALRQSEERRSRAMRAGQVGTFEYYPGEDRIVWDPMTVEIFGFEPGQDISLDDVRAVIDPQDHAAWEADLAAALDPAGPGRHFVELRITRRRDGAVRWVEGRGETTFAQGRATAMLGTLRDITERRRHEEQLRLLNRELRHRVNNLFSVVQALILTSARGAPDLATFVPALRARIDALAAAHLVGVAEEQFAPVPLREMVEAVMRPHRSGRAELSAAGPDLSLPPRLVTPLGLVLHELATNAVKHGAWSCPDGEVVVTWSVSTATTPPRLELVWQERAPRPGGSGPGGSGGSGFGGRLIDASLHQIRGRIRRTWRPEGLQAEVSVPVEQEQAE